MRALGDVDALLMVQGVFAAGRSAAPWRRVAPLLVCAGVAFGMTMGSFGGRGVQAFYSGVKVPLLVLVSTLVALPSFFVVNAVLGLRKDFGEALRAVLAAQGTVAVCLASAAPLVAFLYVSGSDYGLAIMANGGVFLLAALGGQITLGRHYRELLARNPLHRWGRVAWLTVYVFVAIQMAWMLRPFVGEPTLVTRFIRSGELGNAYVEVAGIVWRFLRSLV
jgi:hypothetical protein